MLRQGGETNDLIRAAYAIARIGGPAATGPLLRSLDEVDSGLRPLIVEALDQTGPEALDVLVRLLDHDDPAVRAMAVRHLLLRSRGREVLRPLLAKVLEDRDREVTIAALQGVGRFGLDGKEVAPRLVELQATGDAAVRVEAAVALVQVEGTVPDASMPILRDASRDDRGHRPNWRVIEALGRAGPRAVPWLASRPCKTRAPSA